MANKSPSGVALHALTTGREDAIALAQHGGRKELASILRRAEGELARRLAQAKGLNGAGSDSFTAAQAETALKQVRLVLRDVQRGIKTTTLAQGNQASDAAVNHVLDYMQRANRAHMGLAEAPLPFKEAEMLSEASRGVEASILRRLGSGSSPESLGVLQRYGMATVKHFEEEMQVALITRRPWDEVKESLIAKSPFLKGAPGSWAERIVRTETMGAYNRATASTMEEVNEELGDMVKILSATFDQRTGWDSYQVHGQIRRTGEPFEWAGGLYMHPPNRPNDREIIVPHRIAWPIPSALRWKSDGEVMAKYREQRKSGSPGPRPKMTTVDLKLFGKEQPQK